MSENKYGPSTAAVGVHLARLDAYLALLSKLTDEQWAAVRTAARDDARRAERDEQLAAALDGTRLAARWAARHAGRFSAWVAALEAGRDATRGEQWEVARAVAWAGAALVVHDLITPEEFGVITAPVRAAGIGFDALVTDPRSGGTD